MINDSMLVELDLNYIKTWGQETSSDRDRVIDLVKAGYKIKAFKVTDGSPKYIEMPFEAFVADQKYVLIGPNMGYQFKGDVQLLENQVPKDAQASARASIVSGYGVKWCEMTDAEKGAILLARHEGKALFVKLYPGEEWSAVQGKLERFADNSYYKASDRRNVEIHVDGKGRVCDKTSPKVKYAILFELNGEEVDMEAGASIVKLT